MTNLPRRAWTVKDGFTVLELLVAIVILAILVALSLAPIASVRAKSVQVRQLSDIRQIGGAVVQYTGQFRDFPPICFPSPSSYPESLMTVTLQGEVVSGSWFTNPEVYYRLLSPLLPVQVTRGLVVGSGGQNLSDSDGTAPPWTPYRLTHTLYAQSSYWTVAGQRPLLGWVGQRIDSISAPSQKGLVYHPTYVLPSSSDDSSIPNDLAPIPRLNRTEFVAWGDLSASAHRQGELRQGIKNRFVHGLNPALFSPASPGQPVLETTSGLAGIDRPK